MLEGPVPEWKLFGWPRHRQRRRRHRSYGLPRFAAALPARFPFAMARLRDDAPLEVTLTGWSPFEPNDPMAPACPSAGLEYRFVNRGRAAWTPCSRSTPATSWACATRPQAVAPPTAASCSWGRRRQGQAPGRGQLRRRRRRCRARRSTCLVPRRLVGSADAGVEGGERGRDDRAAGHRGQAGAGRTACSCR